ncbi:hypothetical protein JTB14_017992 [Gonioctena quinquepunctata]|nr:hypothetical protein JTB14_017992 [Gonioctena quinquepunctata]
MSTTFKQDYECDYFQFNKPIHTLISGNGFSFVVFQNGALYTLEQALEQRKNLNPIDVHVEQIDDILYAPKNNELYFGIIVKTEVTYLYWKKFESRKTEYDKIKLDREGFELTGYVFHILGNRMHLLALYSDGGMYSFPLENTDSDSKDDGDIGELFSIVESVSPKDPVSMVSLDENYIALYGANQNEEGAIFVIYNTQFRVTQSKQPFKLFTSHAKVWQIEDNILLPVGHNLAIIPFLLETEQLAALVGSHKIWQDGLDSDVKIVQELEIGSWDEKLKVKAKSIPANLRDRIDEMIQRGLPESLILHELLPDIFKENDIATLALCIKHFTDIPEKHLSQILKYLLNVDSLCFGKNQSTSECSLTALQPAERTDLIDRILCKSFSEILLLPHLRSDLSMTDVALLLKYIYLIWSDDRRALPRLGMIDTEAKLLQWSCILIDANYQKIVLSKDSSVKETLELLNNLIQEHIRSIVDLKMITPLLSNLKKNRDIGRDAHVLSLRYSVEQLSLY